MQVIPLQKMNGKQFLNFLSKNRVLHVFTIYDLKYVREKTEVWVAFRNDEISGYLLEFDRRIVHTHGDAESVTKLLGFIDLVEPVFVVEPNHLAPVEKFFKPIEPTDPSSKGKITTYLVMKADANTFQPKIKHPVKKLGTEDLDEVSKSLGDEWRKRVENAVRRGLAFGAYEDKLLVSVTTVPEIIGDLALIRGVYTVPSMRDRGFATSACSALVEEAIRLGKKAMLWVAKENLPARKVYKKMGFKKTEHVLLGFKARRL